MRYFVLTVLLFIAVIIIFTITIIVLSVSVSKGEVLMKEQVLEKLDITDNELKNGQKRCGKYFLLTDDRFFDRKRRILYYYKGEDKIRDKDVFLIGIFLPEKFILKIDNNKEIPTIEHLIEGATDIIIIVRMSKKEYKKALPYFSQKTE